MALLRNVITFTADFPDDGVWDEQGNCVAPAGRDIAVTIRDRLLGASIRAGEVVQHSDYGWSFDIGSKVWFLLAECDVGWVATLNKRRPLIGHLLSLEDERDLRPVLAHVQSILEGDGRFSNVLWHTRDDFDHARDDRASQSP